MSSPMGTARWLNSVPSPRTYFGSRQRVLHEDARYRGEDSTAQVIHDELTNAFTAAAQRPLNSLGEEKA